MDDQEFSTVNRLLCDGIMNDSIRHDKSKVAYCKANKKEGALLGASHRLINRYTNPAKSAGIPSPRTENSKTGRAGKLATPLV